MMNPDIRAALDVLFAADSVLYKDRGFMRHLGFGSKPALVNIDLANAWTRPGFPFSCEGMDELIAGVQRLLAIMRRKTLPVVFTTTAFAVIEGPNTDMGLWHHKIPAEELRLGTPAVAIDERVAPRSDEQVIVKKRASAFHGTPLAGFLRAHGVDTVILTGVTMAGCVRHTAEDAIAEGFRPIVVRECVGDRIAGAVEWNLFDIQAKFGDVESLEATAAYLEGLQGAGARRANAA